MATITTNVQTAAVADSVTDWTQTIDFGQFDPSLGTLVDVLIGVTGDVAGTASVQNLGPAAAQVNVSLPIGFEVFTPDTTEIVSLGLDRTASVNLGAAAAASIGGIVASGNTFVVDSANLAQFTGTGTVALTAATSSDSVETGGASLASTLQTEAGATVTVQYDYIAAGTSGGSGSSDSSGSTFTTNIINPIIGSFPPPGSVTTAPQSFTIANSDAGWSDALSVAQFDPSLGTLETINVVINGDIVGSVAAENTGSTAIVYSTTQAASVTLALTGTDAVSDPMQTKDSLSLGAFDGTVDFGGSSGATNAGLTASYAPGGTVTAQTSFGDASALAAFSGTGTVSVPITSAGTSLAQGGANLVSQLTLAAGAHVQIDYTYIPGPVACFAAGTRLATPRGARKVEDLREGDTVLTLSGATAPIEWIGRRSVDCKRHPEPERVRPVRIAPHAFGENRPHRALLLSPDHAVFMEDVLIPVKYLINGSTVDQIDAGVVTYYHIELPRHDVLLAEGLPTESYLETGGRSAFENGGGVMQLHPDFAPDEARIGMVWRTFGYAPLFGSGGQLDRVRARLAWQAKMLAESRAPVKPQKRQNR